MKEFLPENTKEIQHKNRILDIKNKENPESIYNMCNRHLQKSIANIPDEILEKSRIELEDLVVPGPTLNRLRLSFWDKYTLVNQGGEDKISGEVVSSGVCSLNMARRYYNDPASMAYILTPVHTYNSMVGEALEAGLFKLREAVSKIKITDEKGKFSAGQAKFLLSVVNFLDNRVHGTAVQRVEATNVNVDIKEEIDPNKLTPAQIEKRIKDLEKSLDNQTNVIEVKNERSNN